MTNHSIERILNSILRWFMQRLGETVIRSNNGRPRRALVPVHVGLPAELANWLKTEADKQFISRSSLITQLVAAERERQQTPAPGQLALPLGASDAERR